MKQDPKRRPTGFGGAVREGEPLDLALIGVPYDAKSSYRTGAADGPRAIREAAHQDEVNAWTELGIDLRQDAQVVDLGDVDIRGEFAEVAARVENRVEAVLRAGGCPFVMGGDHSITLPVVRALSAARGPLDILHFDAHPDLYEDYQGDRYSHACPFARILEEGLAGHLVQVGIRTATEGHRAKAAAHGVRIIEMKDLDQGERLVFTRPLYISFDIDALDPAFAPGVSHREPGGLSSREAVRMLQNVQGDIIGMDMVEVNPGLDPLGITAEVAAKLMMEVMGKVILGRERG